LLCGAHLKACMHACGGGDMLCTGRIRPHHVQPPTTPTPTHVRRATPPTSSSSSSATRAATWSPRPRRAASGWGPPGMGGQQGTQSATSAAGGWAVRALFHSPAPRTHRTPHPAHTAHRTTHPAAPHPHPRDTHLRADVARGPGAAGRSAGPAGGGGRVAAGARDGVPPRRGARRCGEHGWGWMGWMGETRSPQSRPPHPPPPTHQPHFTRSAAGPQPPGRPAPCQPGALHHPAGLDVRRRTGGGLVYLGYAVTS
jgi:hypothetical protein